MSDETIFLVCMLALIALCAVAAGSENSNFVLGWL